MKKGTVRLWVGSVCAVALGSVDMGCSADVSEPQEIGTAASAALEVVVSPPPDINCFDLEMVDANGVVSSFQVPIQPTMVFRNVGVGAYSATARAYQGTDCSTVPLNAPWGTATPTNVIVKAGARTSVTLDLVKLGRIVVTAQFVEKPEVIASNQGTLGTIAASGNVLAWLARPDASTPGTVSMFTDTGALTDAPVVIATNQMSAGDTNIEQTTGDVYWTNRSSGATDGNGNPIPDGSISRYRGATGAVIVAPAEANPFEIAASAGGVYWNDADSDSIRLFSPSTATVSTFIGGQPTTNSIALVPADAPTRLLWTNLGDGAVRFVNLPSATPIDIFVPPPGDVHQPASVAADATYAYWTDFDPTTQNARILRAPIAGGAPEVLAPKAGDPALSLSFNIEVSDGFVYVVSIDGVKRVAADGTGSLELVQEGEPGGLALTSYGGASYIYWTDNNFGGVVWRARLQ